MGLRQEILPYIDGNGLVAPNRTPGTGQGSDNGPMFTSEYYVMLAKINELTEADKANYTSKMAACVIDGLLNRAPYRTGQEGPDDYYGVLNGCRTLGNVSIPRKLLWSVFRYFGFLNNENPGQKTGASFLVRQLQMIAAMTSAAFPSYWNPLHWVARTLAMPFYWFAAIVIFISCVGAPRSDTDARRLSWHLIQTVAPYSVSCKIASEIWYHRLYANYGALGMRAVAKIYYQDGHPFSKWWVD